MQSIGMAMCNLGVEEAKILAEYMRVMASLTQLSLADNNIGGYYDVQRRENVHTPEGPKAIADALRVNASLTEVRAA